jgi:glycosyltransferase involved in cell wall biosynthesis
MRTILHICDWYRPIGGAEKLLVDTLHGLEQNGCANVVVYNDHADQEPTGRRPEYPCKDMELWEYHDPRAALVSKRAIATIESVIDKHKPDVCHVHNFQNPFVTEYLIARLPCVRSVHDPRLYCFTSWRLLPDKKICRHPLGEDCLKEGCLTSGWIPRSHYELNAAWVIRHKLIHEKMPVLIAESRAQIACLLENGFTAEQISWLPNFTPLRPERDVQAFVAENFDPAEKLVLFVGRASYEKGAAVLIEACRHLKTKCRVVLITAGPLLDEIVEKAREQGGIEVIPGLSYEKTREYYARASVVVVPSVWLENFCLVGLEAFANMKPVIGSRIGGIPDWLKEPETGYLFEPGNAEDLAAKIDLALASPDHLVEMGQAAWRRVRDYYNSDLYLARLLEIYERGIQRYQKEPHRESGVRQEGQ